MLSVSPTESDVFAALRTFLLGLVSSTAPAIFTGSIAGAVLTVSNVTEGALAIGDPVLGENVVFGTVIAALGSGTGGEGTYTVSPSQDGAPATVMTSGIEVIQSQTNRVPEPKAPDFMLMTWLRDPRLSTNLDEDLDCVFQASIAGTVMTVSHVEDGTLRVGATVFGPGVAAGTTVRGVGAPGLYLIAPSQTVGASRLAAGAKSMTQSAAVAIQIDIHGPNSANFAAIVATAFRDEYATEAFAALNPAISPLYADDPRQLPFHNAEQQIEDRFVIEANLQVNFTIVVPQQFADELAITSVPVEVIPSP